MNVRNRLFYCRKQIDNTLRSILLLTVKMTSKCSNLYSLTARTQLEFWTMLPWSIRVQYSCRLFKLIVSLQCLNFRKVLISQLLVHTRAPWWPFLALDLSARSAARAFLSLRFPRHRKSAIKLTRTMVIDKAKMIAEVSSFVSFPSRSGSSAKKLKLKINK